MSRLGLLAPGETPSAADAQEVLDTLNSMLDGLDADGIHISPDIPLPARHEEGLIAMLAVRIAPAFGLPYALLGAETLPGSIAYDARRGRERLTSQYLRVPTSQFDYGLTVSNTQNAVTSCPPPQVWKPKTAYSAGDFVQLNGNVYECTTAGTSATSIGPEGLGSSIADGTVVWSFERVI